MTGGEARSLEVLSAEECICLLQGEEVGRIAFVAQGLVHVVPVNYVADERGSVVFRTAPDALVTLIASAPVAFEVDRIVHDARTGWSVCVHGVGRELNDPDDPNASALRRYDVNPWAEGERHRWFAVVPDAITGRRLGLAKSGGESWWFPGIPTS